MTITLVSIGPGGRKTRADAEARLVEEYTRRASVYAVTAVRAYETANEMLLVVEQNRRRQAVRLVLLDATGVLLRSDEIAENVRRFRDGGVQQMVVAIGPADGWARDTLSQADLVLSLGRITLPHRLALVIAAEQIYRALTILAGHPYHGGH